MKQIPKKYMTTGSYEKGGFRKISPIGIELNNKKLEELECPCCGQKSLYQHFNEHVMAIGEYYIDCENCDWVCPTGPLSDCGDNIAELKTWLEAWYLLGKPKKRINENLIFELYPEGEYRDAVIKEWNEYDSEK